MNGVMPMSKISRLSIGDLARWTGCKVENIGILPTPKRSAGGQRRYARDHLKRLNFVRRSRDLGFTLD